MCTENGMQQLYVMIERVLGARALENNTSVCPSVGFGAAFALLPLCHRVGLLPCFATLPQCRTMCLISPPCRTMCLVLPQCRTTRLNRKEGNARSECMYCGQYGG